MIPKELIHRILLKYPFPNFVETGTQNRVTTNWAKPFFKNVHTVEINPDLFFEHERNLRAEVDGYTFGNKAQFEFENITFYLGDSPKVLPSIIDKLKDDTIFYLDAHYSNDTPTDVNECPVMDELRVILFDEKNTESIIIVDDARLFLGAPPFPHKSKDWVRIHNIFNIADESRIGQNYKRIVTLLDDTVLIYPPRVIDVIDAEWRENFHKRYR